MRLILDLLRGAIRIFLLDITSSPRLFNARFDKADGCYRSKARNGRHMRVRLVEIADSRLPRNMEAFDGSGAPFTSRQVSQSVSDEPVTCTLHFRNVGSPLLSGLASAGRIHGVLLTFSPWPKHKETFSLG
jgi:hypothetical protein